MDTQETNLYHAVLISCFVIGIIFLYFAIAMYRSNSKHFRLLRKYVLAEMELLEKERTRIACDLHDELGPVLATTRMQLKLAAKLQPAADHHLETAVENIKDVTERMGGIARNLTPKVLVTRGLRIALEDFVEQYNEGSKIDMQLRYSIHHQPEPFFALHLYRIVQELIHNAEKHSDAAHVLIQLKEQKKRIYLYYTDDGKGIKKEENSSSKTGLGLNSLESRAVVLGGKMHCKSMPGKGTSYFFELPITIQSDEANNNRNRR